jgi:hypothetical protein
MAARQNSRQDVAGQIPHQLGKASHTAAATPGDGSLSECRTGPFLIGRLVGLACHLARRRPGASCGRYADKIAGGGLQPLPRVVATLRGMLARDLARPGTPGAYRAAAADIAEQFSALDVWPAAPWPPASAAAAEFVLGQHHQSKALTDALADRGRASAAPRTTSEPGAEPQ